MPLDYVLEDENHTALREIGDPKGVLSGLLDRAFQERLPLLSGIDRYGDTTFNRHQMAPVLQELGRLSEWAETDEQKSLLKEIVALCQECESRVHTYITIVGD